MPLTLYSYILREMLKVFVAALAVLVIVMAFGFSLKPLSEGVLGPWQLVKVVAFTMPGMVTFALPFAAALASTMTFFRMSSDNEITACAVSGISYREMLTPVLLLGLCLTVGSFFLSNWIVPRFWKLVAMEVEQDAARLVVAKLQRREVVELGGLILYADTARDKVEIEKRPDGEPVPYNRMELRGAAVAKLDKKQDMHGDYTAERATVDFYHHIDGRTYVTMMLTGVTINEPDSGRLIAIKNQPIEAQEIPSPLTTKPKFLSLPKLQAMALEPELSPDVRTLKENLTEAIDAQRLLQQLAARMRDGDGKLELKNVASQPYVITSPVVEIVKQSLSLKMASGVTGAPAKKVIVIHQVGGRDPQRFEAESGQIDVAAGGPGGQPRVNLLLRDVQVFDPALPTPSTLKQITLPLLRYDHAEASAPRTRAELAEQAKTYKSSGVTKAASDLDRKVFEVEREIKSRLHERGAMSVNGMLVVLLAAVMSMKLRNQVPLAIFFWCFMPTVVAFIMITSGQAMIGWRDHAAIWGITMTWMGNICLATLVGGIYMRLSRN